MLIQTLASSPLPSVNLLLNDNNLSGTIRDGFDSFDSLDFVDFSANALSGTIPSSIFNAQGLRFLYLSNNQLEVRVFFS